jgi:hypothetical protein
MQANIQKPAWPVPDWEMINWIVENGTPPLQDLNPQYFSPASDATVSDAKELTATWVIDKLFPGNPGMNFSKNQMEWVGPRESFRGTEAGMQAMSPNPYMEQERKKQLNRVSSINGRNVLLLSSGVGQ